MAEKRISTVSNIYAKSLIEIAAESNSFAYFKTQLEQVLEVLQSSQDLKIVMGNSSVSTSKKIEILNDIFGEKIDAKILNLLKLLVEKNRFSELEAIYNSYCEMLNVQSNKKTVEIISAIDLTFEQKTNILFKLEHKLNCEVIPKWEVDDNIIAGLLFKFDDYVIDTSIRSKIQNLSKSISR